MAYIYKITNSINGKIYIGKTSQTIEERFKEHCRDSKRRLKEHRPLYFAMNKYGIENFSVEEIEQCEDSEAEEREIYWIDAYDSYRKGYNATIGGDGKPCIDRDLVIKTYKEEQNQTKTAEKLGISMKSVHDILIQNNIPIKSTAEVSSKPIKIKELEKEFFSVVECAQWLIDNNYTRTKKVHSVATKISDSLTGYRGKTSYLGYHFEYLQEMIPHLHHDAKEIPSCAPDLMVVNVYKKEIV